jgi:hypothetical protein
MKLRAKAVTSGPAASGEPASNGGFGSTMYRRMMGGGQGRFPKGEGSLLNRRKLEPPSS